MQAPQSPASQPILVPVSPSSSRSVSASDANGAAPAVAGRPFSVKVTLAVSRCGDAVLHQAALRRWGSASCASRSRVSASAASRR